MAVLEHNVQRSIVSHLRELRLDVLVTSQDRSARRQHSGLPDLFVWSARRRAWVAIEVKTTEAHSVVSATQCARVADGKVHVCRDIEEVLRVLAFFG